MKKLLKKVISLTAALAMAAAYSASATVITGGGTDSVPYYWLQDFNDYTNTTAANDNLPSGVGKSTTWTSAIAGTTAAHSYGDGNYALKAIADGGTAGTSNSYLIIDLEKTYAELFAGGDIILSYDVEFPTASTTSSKTNKCKFRLDVTGETGGSYISYGPYFDGTKLYGYVNTTKTSIGNDISVAENTKYNITLLLHKENDTTVTVKQFCDGVQLVNSSGDPLIVTKTMVTDTTNLFEKTPRLRLYVYSGTTAIIDNVNIKNFTSESIETFGDSASVTEQVCTSSYITLDKNGNKLLYKNTATSGLPELTYKFNNPFDFDGGNKKMLVSFKVELNQDIGYLNGEGVSHLLVPNVSIGSKTVYMPAIEHSGFRARTLPNGGRNGDKPEEYYIQTMTKNKVYYNSVLIEYDATSKTLKYTQYVDGKPMRLKPTNGDAYDVGTFKIENVTEDDLNANISILFQGRNFAAGGLYIDDLAVTTLGTDFNVLQPVIAADNTVTVDAVNKTESIYIMNIILASYKNNELLDVEYEKVKINFTDRQYKFTPSSEFTATGATDVKAFAWNGFAGAMPYAANGVKNK